MNALAVLNTPHQVQMQSALIMNGIEWHRLILQILPLKKQLYHEGNMSYWVHSMLSLALSACMSLHIITRIRMQVCINASRDKLDWSTESVAQERVAVYHTATLSHKHSSTYALVLTLVGLTLTDG